jgi:hypothetical protein
MGERKRTLFYCIQRQGRGSKGIKRISRGGKGKKKYSQRERKKDNEKLNIL